MNRFRSKKKAKEAPDGLVRASTDSDAPTAVKSSKGFRLGKKAPEPEPKPEIDLSTALPSSNDFRTSLLMSGLSARFSMLREQDDPNSKIGKASDDSVLFPKQQSRFNDFDFSTQGLSDIAEVSSINGSIRPPFAFARTDSFAGSEGYGTDDDWTHGSIMNRAKLGEGNNLFGGRQKIMIGNRALYESDVSQSAFQKMREREREQKEQERQQEEEAQLSRPSSPPLSGYNRNRETSSTTSSGGPSITRSSTAATSFTSQKTPSLNGGHTPVTPSVPGATGALERSGTKTRRLYETGLDIHLHEHQFSAMSRIDTLTRQRTLGTNTPPLGGLSPTYGSPPGDGWDRTIAGKQSMPNLQAVSPPLTGTALGTFDFGVRKNSNAASKPFGMASLPLSPPMTEYDAHGILPVQPNDRGKATALGTFSKPAPYDDDKYSQRQLQMQQEREAPPPRTTSPPRPFVARNQQRQTSNRNRADSNATYASDRSRSNASTQRAFLPHDRIPETPMNNITDTDAMPCGTFLASPDGGCSASPNDPAPDQNRFKNYPKPLDLSHLYRPNHRVQIDRPDESQHPAHRVQPVSSPAVASLSLPNMNLQPTSAKSAQPPADSPTLGPGLDSIRRHLRSDSNTSSVYGGVPSAHFTSRLPTDAYDSMPRNEHISKSTRANDVDQQSKYGQDSSTNPMNGGNIQPPPLSIRSPNIDAPVKEARNAWEREMVSRHVREGSTETQKEHQAFQEELAARRRKVREKMKSMVESDSRSTSPLPPHPADWPKDVHQVKSNALGLLKTKTSRSSLVPKDAKEAKEGPPSKALKMLGIRNATSGTLSPTKSRFEDSPWIQEDDKREPARATDATPPQMRALREARRAVQRGRERDVANRHQQRLGSENEQEWPVQRKERERPRMVNQRMDNSWVDSSRDVSRLDSYRMDGRMNNRMGNRMENRMESPRTEDKFCRNHDQSERIPPHMRPRHRTPSRERKPPPVTYAHRHGRSSQESKDSSGTNRSGSRPPSNASRDRSGSDTSGGRSKSRTGAYRDDLAKAMAEGTSSTSQAYEERPTRIMPRSPGPPPAMGLPASPPPIPSPMIVSSRSRSNSKSTPAGKFEKLPTLQTGNEAFEIGCSAPRPSPTAPFVVNPTPALVQPSPVGSGTNTPTGQAAPLPGALSMRKKSVNKSDISEPKFISSTSRMTTVNLPPKASLHNGNEINTPPIPPVNPKRRQTRTMFGGLMGRRDDDEIHSMPAATRSSEEMSTFSADEGESKPKLRQKLRKSSSEGGNLNARARQAANAAPSPAMPGTLSPSPGSPPRPIEGAMF